MSFDIIQTALLIYTNSQSITLSKEIYDNLILARYNFTGAMTAAIMASVAKDIGMPGTKDEGLIKNMAAEPSAFIINPYDGLSNFNIDNMVANLELYIKGVGTVSSDEIAKYNKEFIIIKDAFRIIITNLQETPITKVEQGITVDTLVLKIVDEVYKMINRSKRIQSVYNITPSSSNLSIIPNASQQFILLNNHIYIYSNNSIAQYSYANGIATLKNQNFVKSEDFLPVGYMVSYMFSDNISNIFIIGTLIVTAVASNIIKIEIDNASTPQVKSINKIYDDGWYPSTLSGEIYNNKIYIGNGFGYNNQSLKEGTLIASNISNLTDIRNPKDSNSFNNLQGSNLWSDGIGNLYIAKQYGINIRKYNIQTKEITNLLLTTIYPNIKINRLVGDNYNNLYLSDSTNKKIYQYNFNNKTLKLFITNIFAIQINNDNILGYDNNTNIVSIPVHYPPLLEKNTVKSIITYDNNIYYTTLCLDFQSLNISNNVNTVYVGSIYSITATSYTSQTLNNNIWNVSTKWGGDSATQYNWTQDGNNLNTNSNIYQFTAPNTPQTTTITLSVNNTIASITLNIINIPASSDTKLITNTNLINKTINQPVSVTTQASSQDINTYIPPTNLNTTTNVVSSTLNQTTGLQSIPSTNLISNTNAIVPILTPGTTIEIDGISVTRGDGNKCTVYQFIENNECKDSIIINNKEISMIKPPESFNNMTIEHLSSTSSIGVALYVSNVSKPTPSLSVNITVIAQEITNQLNNLPQNATKEELLDLLKAITEAKPASIVIPLPDNLKYIINNNPEIYPKLVGTTLPIAIATTTTNPSTGNQVVDISQVQIGLLLVVPVLIEGATIEIGGIKVLRGTGTRRKQLSTDNGTNWFSIGTPIIVGNKLLVLSGIGSPVVLTVENYNPNTFNNSSTVLDYLFYFCYPVSFIGATFYGIVSIINVDPATIIANKNVSIAINIYIGLCAFMSVFIWFNYQNPILGRNIYNQKSSKTVM